MVSASLPFTTTSRVSAVISPEVCGSRFTKAAPVELSSNLLSTAAGTLAVTLTAIWSVVGSTSSVVGSISMPPVGVALLSSEHEESVTVVVPQIRMAAIIHRICLFIIVFCFYVFKFSH